jgi:hypothetical protein
MSVQKCTNCRQQAKQADVAIVRVPSLLLESLIMR